MKRKVPVSTAVYRSTRDYARTWARPRTRNTLAHNAKYRGTSRYSMPPRPRRWPTSAPRDAATTSPRLANDATRGDVWPSAGGASLADAMVITGGLGTWKGCERY